MDKSTMGSTPSGRKSFEDLANALVMAQNQSNPPDAQPATSKYSAIASALQAAATPQVPQRDNWVTRALAGDAGSEPQLGFGEMTADSRAGRTPQSGGVIKPGPTFTDRNSAFWRSVFTGSDPRMEVTGIPQLGRAVSSVGEAYEDPSLANVTNAGLQTALAAGRPLTALGAVTGGYGVAAARDADIGLPSLSTPAHAAGKGKQEKQDQTYANGFTRDELEPLANQLGMSLEQIGALGRKQVQGLIANNASAALTSRQQEYDRQVKKAEDARDAELARNRRFSDTEVGKVWDKTGGLAPGLLAAGTGALGRLAKGQSLGYVAPTVAGAVEGAVAANIPLGYNALFTESDNPDKRGYEAYARELPPTHPRKQEWADYAKNLPDKNPVREAASKELYDPLKAIERALYGGAEGAIGGLVGSYLPAIPGRVAVGAAAMPGRINEAHQGAQAAAATAKADRAQQELRAKVANQQLREFDSASAEAGAASAEAARRSGGQTAASGQYSAEQSGIPTHPNQLLPPVASPNPQPPSPPVPASGHSTAVAPQGQDEQLRTLADLLRGGVTVRHEMPDVSGQMALQAASGLAERSVLSNRLQGLETQLAGLPKPADFSPQFNELAQRLAAIESKGQVASQLPRRTPNDAKRYFDAEAGKDGKSQAEIVREYIARELSGGKKFGLRDGDITQKSLLDEISGSVDPIGKSQMSLRAKATKTAAQAHVGKDMKDLKSDDWDKLMSIVGKNGNTYAITGALGLGAAASQMNDGDLLQQVLTERALARARGER